MADAAAASPPVRLVVGLGNPGLRYARTRHNVGQRVVEELATRMGASRFTALYAGLIAQARGPHGPLTLLVPTTFMNESGACVGPAAGSLHASPDQVLVVHDEIDLPFGVVRGKYGGGHGGHNGLKSLIRGLGTADFPRVRLGVGRPPPGFRCDEADWVLGDFAEPAGDVEALVADGVAMAQAAMADGIEAAIARFHSRPPGERARQRHERSASPADADTGDAAPPTRGDDDAGSREGHA